VVPLVDEPEAQLVKTFIMDTSFCASLAKLVTVCCLDSEFKEPSLKSENPEIDRWLGGGADTGKLQPGASQNRTLRLISYGQILTTFSQNHPGCSF